MTSKLRVGLIGIGGIARTHIPGWQACAHTEITAASDLNEEALQRFGEEHGVSKLHTDPEALFADPEIDIIDVCTPNRYHASLSIRGLEAGKHVICEKPLAPTPKEIQDMIQARDRSGKLLMAAQHFRFMGSARAVKAEIDQGSVGHVYHARSWFLRRASFPPRPGFVEMEHSGGGPCIDIGVHVLDLTLWLMGNPEPVSVTGVARAELATQEGAFNWGGKDVPGSFDVEDFAAAFVRFDNGATLVLEVSWMLHHNPERSGGVNQIWLYGRDGGAHWPACELLHTNPATKQRSDRILQSVQDPMEPHAGECVAFGNAAASGEDSPVPAEQSLQVMKILDGVYQSQRAGKEVQV